MKKLDKKKGKPKKKEHYDLRDNSYIGTSHPAFPLLKELFDEARRSK